MNSTHEQTASLPSSKKALGLIASLSILLISLTLVQGISIFFIGVYFPDNAFWLQIISAGLVLCGGLLYLRRRLSKMLQLFSALSGTVLSYGDRDFSFSIHWDQADELADLVAAHNQLGQVLREERLALVQRELLLDSMLQNTPVAMLLVSERGPIVFANITARKILNEGRKLEGHRLESLLPVWASPLREAIAKGGDGLFTVASLGATANEELAEDEIFHLSRRSFTLNGCAHELFLIRQLTLELRRQEVQTWKKVIRVISHELNNSLAPVASLARSANALVEREQYQRLPEILATIADRAVHLENFIHGYARFAKMPAPRLERRPCAAFILSLQTQIDFQLLGNLPEVSVMLDPAQMEQALLNLLKNAHESGSDIDQISVEVRLMHETLRIDINDGGSGMNEDVMANALVPFYSTKRNGTGLGLALAREIVEAHGGRIALNNRSSGGLTVSLFLPC